MRFGAITISGRVFWGNRKLLLNKLFDPSTPSIKKVDDGEMRKTGGDDVGNSGH